MKKVAKLLCVWMSIMLLMNLSGVEVLASATDLGQDEKSDIPADVADEEKKTDSFDSSLKEEQTTSDAGNEMDNTQKEDPSQTMEEDLLADSDLQDEDVIEPDYKIVVNEEHTGVLVTLLKDVWENASYTVRAKNDADEEIFSAEIAAGQSLEVLLPEKAKTYSIQIDAVSADGTESKTLGVVPVMLLDTPVAKAVAGVSKADISWSAVENAMSYTVTNITTGKIVEGITDTTYSFKQLKNDKKYEFSVKAVVTLKNDAEDTEYVYESAECVVSATPRPKKPGKTKGLVGMDGEKCAILTWSKVSGATSYNIYRYNYTKKKWEVIKTKVKKTTYTNTKLSSGKTYKYRVAAVNTGGTGTQSDSVTVSVKNTPGTEVRTIGYKAIVKTRAPLFAEKASTKILKYLNPGTRITTTNYRQGRYRFTLSDGKTYWISKDRLSFTASIWTTKDYSTKVKTDFVNKRGYSSPSKYLIWINQYTQRVMIYTGKKGKWKMIRSCRCATGVHTNMTPKGIFSITYKEKGWFYKYTYEKPIVHFKSANSFHSRIKYYGGGYADATIGRPVSHGCVRLYDADIVFIYEKCPVGTTVVSH